MEPEVTKEAPAGLALHPTVAQLAQRGFRFGTLIDIGCADGMFGLAHILQGGLGDAVLVNIDANPVYEKTLRPMREVLGGHYLITAVADYDGEIDITPGAVAYWDSVRPAGDAYWRKINNLGAAAPRRVPCRRLDSIVAEHALPEPFLIKLDVQGAEAAIFAGGKSALAQTAMVICEADVDDFQELNRLLVEAGFGLFDLSWINRGTDNVMRWFYPVYLRRDVIETFRASFWPKADNEAVVRAQLRRRLAQVTSIRKMLDFAARQRGIAPRWE